VLKKKTGGEFQKAAREKKGFWVAENLHSSWGEKEDNDLQVAGAEEPSPTEREKSFPETKKTGRKPLTARRTARETPPLGDCNHPMEKLSLGGKGRG